MKLVRFAAIVSLGLTSGCALPPKAIVPEGTLVENYLGISTEHDFWMRYMELSAQGEKVDINKLTVAYRECIADEMAQLTPVNVSSAIDKFTQSYLYDDYYDAMELVKGFAGQFKQQHGLEPLYYAGDTCTAKGVKAINS